MEIENFLKIISNKWMVSINYTNKHFNKTSRILRVILAMQEKFIHRIMGRIKTKIYKNNITIPKN